jgi:hypothetical protein
MLSIEEARRKIRVLKRFYMEVINFFIVNMVLIILWLTLDRSGTFWPKYVIVIWGFVLVFKAYRLRIIPLLFHRHSLLDQSWEEKKVRELMQRQNTFVKESSKKNNKRK